MASFILFLSILLHFNHKMVSFTNIYVYIFLFLFFLVPAVAPSNLEYTITSFNQPFLFHFTWTLDQPNGISRSMVHSGFTLACDVGTVGPSEVLFSPGQTILRRSVFTSTIQESYSIEVYLPTNCESTVRDYSCFVMAFNDIGVGPRSENISANLPCNFKSNEYYS